jgi:hypothetical protein
MMLRISLMVVLVLLASAWFIVRPQGRSSAECANIKGIICVPKTPSTLR